MVSVSTTSRSSVATQRPQTQRRPAATAALQLVRSSGMAAGRKPVQEDDASHPLSSSGSNCGSGVSDGLTEDDDVCSINNHGGGGDAGGGGFCDSPPIPNVQGGGGCKGGRSVSELRSSMPEADVLLTMSTRSAARPNLTSGDPIPASRRSLNATLMSCHQSYDPSNTGRIALPKPPSTASRHQPGSIRASMLCLPPHPSNAKVGTESRRGVKASTHQEDIHSLRMLYNRHLQWKFANTKAEAAMRAQKIAAEKSLYGMCVRISGLQNSVTTKRSELEQLKNQKNLYTILETQMTYLDEWSILEDDYTSSISGLIKALRDAIIRLPVTGDVRVDPSEIDLILKSATNIMDALASNVGSCLPKAGGVDNVFSGLARVVSDERAAIVECRDLLSQVQKLQLEECSLRSELVQLHRRTEMGICDPLRG
ncbi:hypothetical protein QJS10_CPB15g01281 [Acorus calamus]|uniref:Uncharacterized protein n=1 Tax=Acorus calamus TaxID=4465 RepID=A0AAV9D5E6_ACOCL|nr:hypothetical protein QJS10_CPB15g01281 [Acorus calamus]